jgi:hypothetical protein
MNFDQNIQYPVHMRPQCPPTVSAKSLRTQIDAIEAGSDRRFYRHLTINEPRERAENIQLARIMFMRCGFMSTGENRTLSGHIDSPPLLDKYDKSKGRSFGAREDKMRELVSTVHKKSEKRKRDGRYEKEEEISEGNRYEETLITKS